MNETTPEIKSLALEAQRIFQQIFGRPATIAAAAPGRVNLIGEHTDYNDGFVLPMAIERQTIVLAAPAPIGSTRVRIASTHPGSAGVVEFNADASLKPGQPAWANYVKGVVAGFVVKNPGMVGFDAIISSTVPLGGGLSSSASLEVAIATAIEGLLGKQLDPVAKALLAQKAEHDFAGMPCGIMDQFISVMGQRGNALLLDCRSRATTLVPLSDPGVTVLIANTNVKHELTGGEYAERRTQCHTAAKALGVIALRDATMPMLLAKKAELDPLVFRRAYHVIGESARTEQAAKTAQGTDGKGAGVDWAVFGRLMNKSHDSLRDDFEVSCSELDVMVEVAQAMIASGDVFGSRMTGGGFGGCTVSLVRTSALARVSEQLASGYLARTNIQPTLFASRPAHGAHRFAL